MEKSVIYKLVEPYKLTQEVLFLNSHDLSESAIFARTEYSLISKGTELGAWKGLPGLRIENDYPRLMGYCNLAQVIKVGCNITDIYPGDYILTHQSHRSAFICDINDVLLQFRNIEPELRKKLTTCYIYYLAYNSLLHGGFKPGYHLAIIGFGPLGFAVSSLASVFGSKPINFTNQDLNGIDFKKMTQMHPSQFFPKDKPISSQEVIPYSGRGFDLVINTSNLWEDHNLAMQISKSNGEIICLGFPGRGEQNIITNPLDSKYFYGKSLTIKHFGYTKSLTNSNLDDFDSAHRGLRYIAYLIESGKIENDSMIGSEHPWNELNSAYHYLQNSPSSFKTGLILW